jgi:hypothetical protein
MAVPVEPFSIAATGFEIISIAKREGWLRKGIDYFRPKNRVLVLGSTGVGKSQFLRSIPEYAAPQISAGARTEFRVVNKFEINSRLFEFVDTPGQLEHKPVREDIIKEEIRNKHFKGVINCVSFGYHEYGEDINSAVRNGVVRADYLERHRRREVDLLGEWAQLLSSEWVMTIVTKADIWWDEKFDVGTYYASGSYREKLRALFPRAHLMVRPYSSTTSRFYNCIPTAGSFDDRTRTDLRTEIFRLLRESAEKKKS